MKLSNVPILPACGQAIPCGPVGTTSLSRIPLVLYLTLKPSCLVELTEGKLTKLFNNSNP